MKQNTLRLTALLLRRPRTVNKWLYIVHTAWPYPVRQILLVSCCWLFDDRRPACAVITICTQLCVSVTLSRFVHPKTENINTLTRACTHPLCCLFVCLWQCVCADEYTGLTQQSLIAARYFVQSILRVSCVSRARSCWLCVFVLDAVHRVAPRRRAIGSTVRFLRRAWETDTMTTSSQSSIWRRWYVCECVWIFRKYT